MKKTEVINILNKINHALDLGLIDVSKDLIQLEIDSLNNTTEHNCKNTKYYFESYCKKCTNMQCVNNRNEEINK